MIITAWIVGYLMVGLVLARIAWRMRSDDPGDDDRFRGFLTGAVFVWPFYLTVTILFGVWDGVRWIITRPTKQERIAAKITELEKELNL